MKPIQKLFIFDRREMFVLTLMGLVVALFTFTLGIHLGKRVGNRTWVASNTEASAVHTLADHVPNRQELTEQAKGVQQALEEALTQELHDEVIRAGLKLDSPRQLQLPEHAKTENAGATSLTSNSHHESTGHNSHESHSIHSVASHNSHETHSAHSVASHDTHGDHNSHDASSSHDTPAAHTSVASHDAHNAHDTNNAHSPHDTHTAQNDHHTENRKIASEGESHHDAQYTLQIGSFPNLAEAKKQLSALQKAELKAFLHEAAIKGKGKWYRLYLGGYSSREAAEEAGEKYKTENKIHSFIVTKSPS